MLFIRESARYNDDVEHEPKPTTPKLIEVVRQNFPHASEVLISFPDRWEYVDTLRENERSIYIGAFPLERARIGRDHFHGLAPEINVSLVFYRLYRFFEPWPMPTALVDWKERAARGQLTDMRDWKLQLQPIGQAQAWFGVDHVLRAIEIASM